MLLTTKLRHSVDQEIDKLGKVKEALAVLENYWGEGILKHITPNGHRNGWHHALSLKSRKSNPTSIRAGILNYLKKGGNKPAHYKVLHAYLKTHGYSVTPISTKNTCYSLDTKGVLRKKEGKFWIKK